MTQETQQVIAGFIPLLDSAVLVAASRRGFAEEEGLDLKLVRETSWANIRDRLFVGHFDVAHILAPMTIASSLSLTSLAVPMRAMMVLGRGGNAITVSNDLADQMRAHGWQGGLDPVASGQALARYVRARLERGLGPLRFGVVHAFSGHAYELRYWLAAEGIDPDTQIKIRILPPSLMADALKAGQIDGYCVGEPWNAVAVLSGDGVIVTCKQAIWPDSPEKVLGVTERWAAEKTDCLDRLIRALSKAAEWCADAANVEDLADLLCQPDILGCPKRFCLSALKGQVPIDENQNHSMPGLLAFVGGSDAAPDPACGLWFYSQMLRWGQADYQADHLEIVQRVFDPARMLKALTPHAPTPTPPDSQALRFFDGKLFDPAAFTEGLREAD